MIKFYNGIMYNIQLQPGLSNTFYGERRKTYYIYTEDENYGHARKAIRSIMDDGSYTAGEHQLKASKSMAHALHSWHEFSYNPNLDVYIYTLIHPYDD